MENNYCIIMAGGVGSRFWPFSTITKPKQFLDFFGTGRSLLQMTYDRFRNLIPAKNVYIVSNLAYRDLILEQLPELTSNQVLLEPIRRNTAPCIAYAVYKIREQTEKANIIIVPSDHLITKEDEYRRVMQEGIAFVAHNTEALLTIGLKPTRPETGYGYIQVGDGEKTLCQVKTFTEKPSLEMAKVFLASGEFYWNSGMFLWSLTAIEKAFKEFLPEVAAGFEKGRGVYHTGEEQIFIDKMYPELPNISIDYGIMEKAQNVYVLTAEFGWSDLGTWNSLYELGEKDAAGNATLKGNTQLYDCKNTMVVIPEDSLAVVEGLTGYLIAQQGNVLLICKTEGEQRLRQYVVDVSERPDGEKYIKQNR
ncbi:MAG: mannose-1-phosphate guanylyltransferase [Prevotellaceae bacterium]|jgi:mannose-1-phosphate guanylyltransferase|nr:mannose-1-phosphate guanylyltransferase [Prevotellaceae bacterium]